MFFSENIEESPLKKDKRISEERTFKIPEFPYNENNIKSVKRVLLINFNLIDSISY
jgi:hypothetical protein